MKYFHLNKARFGILFLTSILGLSFISPALVKIASAAAGAGYQYTNSSYNAITGPLMPDLTAVPVTFSTGGSSGFGAGHYGHTLTQQDIANAKNHGVDLSACGFIVIVTSDGKNDGNSSGQLYGGFQGGCAEGTGSDHAKSVNINNGAGASSGSGTPSSPGGDPASATHPTCDSEGWNLSWIVCPVINWLADAADGIYNSLIVPLLVFQPIQLSNPSGDKTRTYAVWSEFRIYGDIFLVIALLVVVFGESIGGGMIDAYTAKKVLPRLLVAAILINLSIYLVALAVDVTNILGQGMEALIEAPWRDIHACTATTTDNCFHLRLNAGSSDTLGVGALLGSTGLIWGLIKHTTDTVGVAVKFISLVGWTFLVPAVFTLVAIFVTLVVRQGLILLLILISPVAFALYCLPNTEQYFRKWWDLLVRTLLIYPIVGVAFAIGNVLSITINSAASGLGQYLASFVSIAVMFIPLVMIPYAFRIAGGAIARAHDAVAGARDRAHQLTEGRRERAKRDMSHAQIQARQNLYAGLQARSSKSKTRFGKRGYRMLGSGVTLGQNMERLTSAARADKMKELNDITESGKDDEVRGLSVNKKESEGQVLDDGTVQYKSLAGKWINEADVDAGHARWGRDSFAQQAALSYEMRKATTEAQTQDVADNFAKVAQAPGGWGMSDQQAGGIWQGAAFQNQNQHVEYKYTDWKTGQIKPEKVKDYVSEVYEKRGSYNLSQMGSNTIEQLKFAHESGDAETKQKVASIAETFMHQYGGVGGDEKDVAAMTAEAQGDRAAGRIPIRQVNAPGAAHLAERVRELAVQTGVYKEAPSGYYSERAHYDSDETGARSPNSKGHS